MGVEYSRIAELPHNINDPDIRKKISDSWVADNITGPGNEKVDINFTFLTKSTLDKAAIALSQYFDERNISNQSSDCALTKEQSLNSLKQSPDPKLTLVEVFAGNGRASLILQVLCGRFFSEWVKTDIREHMGVIQMHAVKAVETYPSDVLLLICPPPYNEPQFGEQRARKIPNSVAHGDYGYADYYAYVNFIKQPQSKFIIFLGELGAADGSSGTYKYLIEHPNLNLDRSVIISESKDIFGGPVIKELFIFRVNH